MPDLEGLLDKIHNTDFLKLVEKIPNESIDLIVTSPPYNIGKEYEKRVPLDVYIEWSKKVIKECTRILKKSGSIFWQIGTYVASKGAHYPLDIMLFPVFLSNDLLPRNRIIWIRPHGTHGKYRFSNRHETMLWFTKSYEFKFNLDEIRVPQKFPNKTNYRKGKDYGKFTSDPRGKNPGDIWAFRNVKHNHEEQTEHPCQFPEDMVTRIILSTTDRNDIVLDPFMGVGSVAVVARDYNRRFIGSELLKRYTDIANHRLSGEPDENNNFPNLKTLRQYVTRTGKSVNQFTFTRQVGKKPSMNSKIYPESHHLNEITNRVLFEAENAQYKKKFSLEEGWNKQKKKKGLEDFL